MTMRIWCLVACLLFPFSQALCGEQDEGGNRYHELLALLRSASPDEGTDKIELDDGIIGNTSFGKLTLSARASNELALHLMASNDAHAQPNQSVLFGPDAWKSLKIITGNPSVLDMLGYNKTIFGRLFLAKLLTAPTTDVDLITKRQYAIRSFCLSKSLKATVDTYLSNIARLQPHLLSLADENHPIYSDDIKLLHHNFIFRKLVPHNRTWENIVKVFADVWYLANPTIPFGFLHFLHKNVFTEKSIGYDNWRSNKHKALYAALFSYMLYQTVNTVKLGFQRGGAINYMYHQMKPLRALFVALRKLRKIAEQLPAIQALKGEIDLDIIDQSPDMIRLRQLLEGPAFNNPAMAQMFGGDIIIAVELLKKCRTRLFKGIGLLGAFDAYSGLASWYQASERGKLPPICFASLIKSDSPRLAITDFWHPTLPTVNTRTNSIKLGAPQANNAIITGLFESGKSKLLHSVALNVLCAQTFGLCPARSYVGTPYAAINVYANIKDDLANDRSLFKTELFRALQLLEFIKKLPKGSFSFSIADSTFTGTEAGAGRAAAYAVARYLGDLPNSTALHATNFLSMALLGKQAPEKFTNYYLPSVLNGTVEHSYTLTPGVQKPHLATAIFKEEGLPEAMLEIINQQLGSAV